MEMIKKLWMIPVLALLAACSGAPKVPSISDSGVHLPGKFIWRDLITPNPEAAQAFYRELLGWEFEALGESGYSLIRHNGKLIGGMADANKIGQPVKSSLWLSAISVSNIKQTVRAVTDAGGKVIYKPSKILNRGHVAVIMDRDGAMLQLIHSPGGDPLDVEPEMNQWLWTELIANDLDGAADFYQKVFGYKVETVSEKKDADYRILVSSGAPRGGMSENPFEDTRSVWIPFIRVSDPKALSEKAAELGGRVVVEANKKNRKGLVALILDPSGAPIALQKWSSEEKEGI